MSVALTCLFDSSNDLSVVAVLMSLRSWLFVDFADKQISPAYVLNWTKYDIKLIVDSNENKRGESSRLPLPS